MAADTDPVSDFPQILRLFSYFHKCNSATDPTSLPPGQMLLQPLSPQIHLAQQLHPY